jgi:hypothetical protein
LIRAPISTFTSYFFLYPFLRSAGEPQWLRGPIGRPLEPDAGNAAEGSEGPMPDWRFQPCDFSAHGFFVVRRTIKNSGTQEWRKGISDIEGKAAMGSGEEATAATEFQKNLRRDQLPWLRGFQIQSL